MPLRLGRREFADGETVVMAIVNRTPDSFFDQGGYWDFDAFLAKAEALVDEGVACSDVINHDDSEWTISEDMYPGVYVRSVYFQDPDGILLELAAWTRGFTSDDVAHAPATAAGERAATPSTVAVAAEAL